MERFAGLEARAIHRFSHSGVRAGNPATKSQPFPLRRGIVGGDPGKGCVSSGQGGYQRLHGLWQFSLITSRRSSSLHFCIWTRRYLKASAKRTLVGCLMDNCHLFFHVLQKCSFGLSYKWYDCVVVRETRGGLLNGIQVCLIERGEAERLFPVILVSLAEDQPMPSSWLCWWDVRRCFVFCIRRSSIRSPRRIFKLSVGVDRLHWRKKEFPMNNTVLSFLQLAFVRAETHTRQP